MGQFNAILRSLYSEPGWATLAVVLRVLFLVAMVRIFWLLLRPVEPVRDTRNTVRPGLGFVILVVVPFLGVMAYQASWQLVGFTRPQFLKFMQQYDRRQFNPARAIHRGKILDRGGKILAYTYVDAQNRPKRIYPHKGAACHLTGYMDPIYGLAGVEAASNATLTGGRLEDVKDWRELGKQWLAGHQEIRGDDVKLSIDIELQRSAWLAMRERPGAVLVMDVRSGQILTMVSTPSFDPSQIDGGLFQGDDDNPRMLNRATHGLYPPGSTLKVLVGAAACREGFTASLNCNGTGYTTSQHYPPIKDHEFYEKSGAWGGHGLIGFPAAMAESCNEYFSQLGVRLGQQKLLEVAQAFSFGAQAILYQGPNGILRIPPGPGFTVAASDKYGLAQASIGQGRMVCSPAHLLLIAAAVANHGVLMKPTLEFDKVPEVWSRPLTAPQAARLASAMHDVVVSGTGRGLKDLSFAVAGKTGTAQTPRGASHAWFVGFAPYHAPKVAVCVLVEHGGYGSTSAVPVARDVLKRALELGWLGDG